MATVEMDGMADDGPRALVTDREIEILEGEADVTEDYYHVVVTRVRNRIQRLERELDAIDNHDSLREELETVVCSEE